MLLVVQGFGLEKSSNLFCNRTEIEEGLKLYGILDLEKY